MIHTKKAIKLGRRLRNIEKLIEPNYSTIWDCCCDHGLLGMALLERKAADQVVFIDVLENQMSQLKQRLVDFFPRDDFCWQVICDDMNNIVVPQMESQLFVIAGVGGDKTIEFVNSLCESSNHTNFDLIVCSVHGNYQVRQALIDKGFFLVNERIVMENNRYYEIIYVSTRCKQPITLTGSSMWDWNNPMHVNYWQKTMTHFRKKAKTNPEDYQNILRAYERLNK